MALSLNLRIKGLCTNPSNFSEAPAGSLSVARNVVLDRESILESRRGFKWLADSTYNIESIFNYTNLVMVHTAQDEMLYLDGSSVLQPFSGSYAPPVNWLKIKTAQQNGNFYFTTANGIYKLDSSTGSIREAGAPRGLAGVGTSVDTPGFLSDGTNVGYRVLWGYRDANNNLILGSPSQRIIVSNTSGVTSNVALVFYIPDEIDDTWFYQVYRSKESVDINTEPDDELQLVYEDVPTATDLSNGYISIKDVTPVDLMGAALYTNSNQQGINQSNERPPIAVDIATYKQYVMYANTSSRQQMTITLISVAGDDGINCLAMNGDTHSGTKVIDGIADTTGLRPGMRVWGTGIGTTTTAKIVTVDTGNKVTLNVNSTATATVPITYGDIITIDGVEYYGYTGTNVAKRTFYVENSLTPAENISITAQEIAGLVSLSDILTMNGTTHNGTKVIDGITSTADLTTGMAVSGTGIGTGAVISTIDSGTQVTLSVNSTANGTVSLSFGTADINGFYMSNYGDLPGKILLEAVNLDHGTFTVFSTALSSFSPSLASAQTSSNESRANRVFISKISQPEAVPLLNYIDVGSRDFPIRRMLALRDSVFFFKDDGVYRLTGETVGSFTTQLFDSTVTLTAYESAVVFNNQVLGVTNQGITATTDNGIQVLSRNIETDLLSISEYAEFDTSFGVAYESERKYILWTLSNSYDTSPTQAIVWNSFTNSFTVWTIPATCAYVGRADDLLYYGNADELFIERKTRTLLDYADQEYACNITGLSTDRKTITLTSVPAGIGLGYTISINPLTNVKALITAIGVSSVTVDREFEIYTGAAVIYQPIANEAKFLPIDIQSPTVVKSFSEIIFLFKDAAFTEVEIGFYSNFTHAEERVSIGGGFEGSWGMFPWGLLPWGGIQGGQTPVRTYFPLQFKRAHWQEPSIYLQECFSKFGLQGIGIVYEQTSTRFKGQVHE